MLTVLHGKNITASRNNLLEIISSFRGREVRRLNGAVIDETSLVQALEAGSLYHTDKITVIENLLSGNSKKLKKLEALIGMIKKSYRDTEIIMWEEKEITPATLKKLPPETKVMVYKIPVLIFSFLDNLRPGNSAYLLDTFARLKTIESAELVYAMMVNRLRSIIIIKDGQVLKSMAAWQVSRISSQSRFFTMEKLISLYGKLLDIEVNIRSGKSPLGMEYDLETFLSNI